MHRTTPHVPEDSFERAIEMTKRDSRLITRFLEDCLQEPTSYLLSVPEPQLTMQTNLLGLEMIYKVSRVSAPPRMAVEIMGVWS